MTDSPIHAANDHTRTLSNIKLQPLLRNRAFLLAGAISALALGGMVLSTGFTGPKTIPEGGNLVDVTGLNAALKIGEKEKLKVRLLVYGKRIPVDYAYARNFKGQTKHVGIVIVVPPRAVVEERWWRWSYTPPPAS